MYNPITTNLLNGFFLNYTHQRMPGQEKRKRRDTSWFQIKWLLFRTPS